MLEAARALSELAAELGRDAATLSVAWAAQNAAVTAPIISARNFQQLKPSLDAKDLMLSAAVLRAHRSFVTKTCPSDGSA
jgi:aryl-alcohol dehydrogenase-like predicted oxidoreductase